MPNEDDFNAQMHCGEHGASTGTIPTPFKMKDSIYRDECDCDRCSKCGKLKRRNTFGSSGTKQYPSATITYYG